jgi:hypothetical protein
VPGPDDHAADNHGEQEADRAQNDAPQKHCCHTPLRIRDTTDASVPPAAVTVILHQKLVATDNTNRYVPDNPNQTIEELRDELLQDMADAGLVKLLPAPP